MTRKATEGDFDIRFKNVMVDRFQLPEIDWHVVSDYFQPRKVDKNEFFVSSGKVCRELSFIEEGVMRYCFFREDGSDTTCVFMREGDFVGDPESFFSRTPSDKNLQALTNCQLMVITFDRMQQMLREYPQAVRLNAAIDHYVMTKMLDQRTAILNMDAKERYQKFIEDYPDVIQRVSLNHVASFLGITQQSLSRLRKEIS